MDDRQHGLLDNWLRHVKDVRRFNEEQLKDLPPAEQFDLLCELNVKEQFANVCNTSVVQNAWENGMELTIHGWIYSIENGILNSLSACDASGELTTVV